MNAQELQQQVSRSVLWFAGLVAGCSGTVWLLLSAWPDEAEVGWLARLVVVATHLLIWRNSVGRLHDVALTGGPPAWLVLAYNTWLCLLLFFQAGCIFCLPIIDILRSSEFAHKF